MKWKIAFIYAPNHVLSIYTRKALVYLSNARGADFDDKTPISMMQRYLIRQLPKGVDIFEFSALLWYEYVESSAYEGSPKEGTQAKVATEPYESTSAFVEEDKEAEQAEAELSIAELYEGFEIFRSDAIDPVFNVPIIARQFAKVLSSLKKEEGQMVGVFGQWGRGKTYFIKYLCSLLNIDYDTGKPLRKNKARPFHFVKFHAWKYQDTEAVWAYLYECLSRKYLGSHFFIRTFNTIWLQLIRHFRKTLTALISAILVIVPLGILLINKGIITSDLFDNVPELLSALLGTFGLSLMYYYKKYGPKARIVIKRYTEGVSFKETLGLQAEIQNEIVSLLDAWYFKYENWFLKLFYKDPPRILLFVDDLDRCGVDKMIHVVDAMRVMLEEQTIIKRMLILVAVDQDKLKIAIKNKYFDSLSSILSDDELTYKLTQLEKEYMDKLFISGIRLSKLSSNERRDYFNALTKDRVEREEVEAEVDSGGKITTIVESEFSGDESSPNLLDVVEEFVETSNESPDKEQFELSQYEKGILDEVVKEMHSATPRQIRIYYYRYLLAKNILSKLETIPLSEKEVEYLSRALNGRDKLEGVPKNERIEQVVDLVVTY